MALEPYQTSISTSALGKINRWMLQKKAAGQKVEPWEMEAAYKAALSTEADRASQNYARNKSLALDEKKFESDVAYRDKALESSEKASTMSAVGNLASTGLGAYAALKSLKSPKVPPAPTISQQMGSAAPAGSPPGTYPTDMPDWNPLNNTGTPSGPPPTVDPVVPTTSPTYVPAGPEVYPANVVDPSTGQLIEAGMGTAEAGAGAAGIGGAEAASAAAGAEAAELAAIQGNIGGGLTAAEATSAAGLGAGTTGGATLGSIAGGAASALPWIAAWKAGMPILKEKIMQPGTKAVFGVEPDSSNTLAQMNRMAGSSRGVVAPAYEEITGNEMPEVAEALLNPAGYIFGKKLGCIIVTACTSPDSEEVNIAREYRDKHLTPEELRGYYVICEKVAPLIHRFALVKSIAKKVLVDNLIKYGRHRLGKGPFPGALSIFVTTLFLDLCRAVGRRRTSFIRCTGEEV